MTQRPDRRPLIQQPSSVPGRPEHPESTVIDGPVIAGRPRLPLKTPPMRATRPMGLPRASRRQQQEERTRTLTAKPAGPGGRSKLRGQLGPAAWPARRDPTVPTPRRRRPLEQLIARELRCRRGHRQTWDQSTASTTWHRANPVPPSREPVRPWSPDTPWTAPAWRRPRGTTAASESLELGRDTAPHDPERTPPPWPGGHPGCGR